MEIKVIFESNGEEISRSLDDVTKSFLDAVQRVVRKELETVLTQPAPREGRDAQSPPNRPLALSKAKAAQALGISVRTIDYCIANHGIRVTRIGRRVLVPLNSLETLLKQGISEIRASR
jgi:excisionase family DNA binding protein